MTKYRVDFIWFDHLGSYEESVELPANSYEQILSVLKNFYGNDIFVEYYERIES
jgi:hypothetical protein